MNIIFVVHFGSPGGLELEPLKQVTSNSNNVHSYNSVHCQSQLPLNDFDMPFEIVLKDPVQIHLLPYVYVVTIVVQTLNYCAAPLSRITV